MTYPITTVTQEEGQAAETAVRRILEDTTALDDVGVRLLEVRDDLATLGRWARGDTSVVIKDRHIASLREAHMHYARLANTIRRRLPRGEPAVSHRGRNGGTP